MQTVSLPVADVTIPPRSMEIPCSSSEDTVDRTTMTFPTDLAKTTVELQWTVAIYIYSHYNKVNCVCLFLCSFACLIVTTLMLREQEVAGHRHQNKFHRQGEAERPLRIPLRLPYLATWHSLFGGHAFIKQHHKTTCNQQKEGQGFARDLHGIWWHYDVLILFDHFWCLNHSGLDNQLQVMAWSQFLGTGDTQKGSSGESPSLNLETKKGPTWQTMTNLERLLLEYFAKIDSHHHALFLLAEVCAKHGRPTQWQIVPCCGGATKLFKFERHGDTCILFRRIHSSQ